MRWRISGTAVENLWVEAKIGSTWYLFGRCAEERGACSGLRKSAATVAKPLKII
jgi:hypothetical protein